MKFLELRLIAHGPFTDMIIYLSGGNEGLHIIYGPNEAGKSSALRTLQNLLYGIPERSKDNFLHPYSRMRVGGAIQSGKGDVLKFVRRKGRSNTLRLEDDKTVIEESLLNRFLRGIDADLFVTMFGIDHADLVRGGKEIIGVEEAWGNLFLLQDRVPPIFAEFRNNSSQRPTAFSNRRQINRKSIKRSAR